ncbi:hypothetical protein TrRE_jg8450 [Triparma retinervis]|uniref:Prephenate dehydratase domain-containing protein n=1 Tax=Triparma retinervis TaxID=2557542 RepID=A0A9W7FXE0_9STRA|nr:hypothetical protein TrRE_jg8450 [Triparma retinervis]
MSHLNKIFYLGPPASGSLNDAAIVPTYNTTSGPVTDTLAALESHPSLVETSSFPVTIVHSLLTSCTAPSDVSKITKVYSKSQALHQCSASLSSLLPDASLIPVTSTSSGLRMALSSCNVSDGVFAAAVCNRAMVDVVEGARVLRENVNDDVDGNVTTFKCYRVS